MPLSEQEQRLLDEMERNLYGHDADFVSTAGDKRGRPSYRSIALGALIAILGIGALIVGVVLQQPVIGIIGFIAMLGGVMVAITPSKNAVAKVEPEQFFASNKSGGRQAPASSGGFMDRMNDRWDKRDDNQR
ncbi:DUF3040 domain-containing protein [Mycetocola spongiae]|nr:DUF3040 domain-containing protein [Mycetocola spongiae]